MFLGRLRTHRGEVLPLGADVNAFSIAFNAHLAEGLLAGFSRRSAAWEQVEILKQLPSVNAMG